MAAGVLDADLAADRLAGVAAADDALVRTWRACTDRFGAVLHQAAADRAGRGRRPTHAGRPGTVGGTP